MKIRGTLLPGNGKHRKTREPVYWRFTYRMYQNRWWFFWKPALIKWLKGE